MDKLESDNADSHPKRDLPLVPKGDNPGPHRAAEDPDANAGSDYDAMPDSDVPSKLSSPKLSIPNSMFSPARILVNPRCVTTYAGVSHAQLAIDLFGPERDVTGPEGGSGKYVLDDWEGAPESFVCQEQLYVISQLLAHTLAHEFRSQTGGRKATKTQRRLQFAIHNEVVMNKHD